MTFPNPSNCRLCRGDRYVRKTSRELKVDVEFARLMDLVFEPEPEVFGLGGPRRKVAPPGQKICPECYMFEWGYDSDSIFWLGDMREELKALRILAKRTERGEKFTRKNLGMNRPSDLLRDSPLPKPKIVKPKTSKVSLSEQLTQLAALRESGALTAQEFKLAKERLLGTSKTTAKGKSKKKKSEGMKAPRKFGSNQTPVEHP